MKISKTTQWETSLSAFLSWTSKAAKLFFVSFLVCCFVSAEYCKKTGKVVDADYSTPFLYILNSDNPDGAYAAVFAAV